MKIVKRTLRKGYDKGRAAARIAYTAIPTALYALTHEKMADVEALSKSRETLENTTNYPINELHGYATKGMGLAFALLASSEMNRRLERRFADHPKIKSLAKVIAPVAAANVLNATSKAIDYVAAHSLESNVQGSESLSMSSDATYQNSGFLDSIYNAVRSNFQDTLSNAYESITNITSSSQDSDFESGAKMAVATLIALPAIKLGYKALAGIYHFMADNTATYEARRYEEGLKEDIKSIDKYVKKRRNARGE